MPAPSHGPLTNARLRTPAYERPIGRLIERPIGRPIERPIGRLVGRLIGRLIESRGRAGGRAGPAVPAVITSAARWR